MEKYFSDSSLTRYGLFKRNQTWLNLVILLIYGFHYATMQGIWVEVNLNYIDPYAVLESSNNAKIHVLASKHKANTYCI